MFTHVLSRTQMEIPITHQHTNSPTHQETNTHLIVDNDRALELVETNETRTINNQTHISSVRVLGQSSDHIAQVRQRLVDPGSLLQSVSRGSSSISSLTASQVHYVDGGLLLHLLTSSILGLLNKPDKIIFKLCRQAECSHLIPTMVWALEDVAFMLVLAMVLFTLPSSILADISA